MGWLGPTRAAACATGIITACVLAAGNPLGTPAGPTTSAVLTDLQAVRLAKQATFGPTPALVDRMKTLTAQAWVEEQFALSTSTYADFAARSVPRNYCTERATLAGCNRDYLSATPVAMRFYANAVGGQDQLRQRVAFALSQLIVVSDTPIRSTAGSAVFNDMLLRNAFGNYRDILRAATLSPYMGDYLDMADSNRTAPNENYARELMQLFSLGVNLMTPDGREIVDDSGAAMPAYTSTDVREVARALTGWTYARLPGGAATDFNFVDYAQPMVPSPARYDTGSKTFLGRTVPANASQTASVDAVVDAVFSHANTAPNVSKFLIQHLVVSNPTPAYVERVSRVFADNGAGVRGDLKAVVRAILLDPEARTNPEPGSEGKVKEPVLMAVGLARAIGMTTDGYAFTTREASLGQQPFRAPSVFNFYPPDYPLPLGDNLLSPASKLMSTGTTIARHNLAYDWTVAGDPSSRSEFNVQANLGGATGTQPLWGAWEAFGTNVDAQLDQVTLLLLENRITVGQRAAFRAAMTAVTNTNAATQSRRRAQVALYLAASSPLFQIDR